MKRLMAIWVLLIALPLGAREISPQRRDTALKTVAACINARVQSKACKNEKAAEDILIQIYRDGDKSVLPTLLRIGYLAQLYQEQVVADTDSFLSALAVTPKEPRGWVIDNMVGGVFGLNNRQRYDAIHAALKHVPLLSPNRSLADECLRKLEKTNASLFLEYFPPGALTSRSGQFKRHWYSSEMYGLAEKPLWPAANQSIIYRFTWLRSFKTPIAVCLTVLPDGTGLLRFKTLSADDGSVYADAREIPADKVATVVRLIDVAEFWKMPTEGGSRGLEGGEWILEGNRSGEYHIVTRWSAEKTALGRATLALIDLADHRPPPEQVY